MVKKLVLFFILVSFLAGSVFAQKADKHQGGAILIGADLGLGFTPDIFKAFNADGVFSKGNYAFYGALGAHLDFYLGTHLSLSSGLMLKRGAYAFLDREENFSDDTSFQDIAKTTYTLTVPIMMHINFPFFQWLYAGAGVQLNFPFKDDIGKLNMKGGFFYGIPIDLGFDFITAGQGGMRLFLRAIPEFHDGKMVMPIGINWQVFNIKLR
jgi:hypothetical protein